MPDITCRAGKPHAELYRTAFRAVCGPHPAASRTPAQAPGHELRCRNAAAARA